MSNNSIEAGLLTAITNPPANDDELTAEGNRQLEHALKILDDFQAELNSQRENKANGKADAHLPDILKGSGLNSQQIFDLLKETISETEFEVVERFLASDEKTATGTTDLLAASASLQNIIAYLPDKDRKILVERIKEEVSLYLSKLYRFDSTKAVLHLEDDRDSAVYVTRLAMATKYDQYETDGYLELNEAAPVIYISQAGPASLAAQICHRLGLPVSCIAVVPTTTVERDSDALLHVESLSLHKHEMNCAALDRMIREDTAAGKKPCIVLANGGSPALGHDDPIHLLQCGSDEIEYIGVVFIKNKMLFY